MPDMPNLADYLQRMKLSQLFPVNENRGGTPMNGDMIPLQRNKLSTLFDVNNPSAAMQETPTETVDLGQEMAPPQEAAPQPKTLKDYGYEPQHVGIDQMNDMVTHMPQRPTEMGWRNRTASILAAFGGAKEPELDRLRYPGYHQQLEDWQTKFKPVEELATQERGANTQGRAAAESMMRNQAAADKLAEDERIKTEQNRLREKQIGIQDYLARNPKAEYKVNSDGYLIALKNGAAEYVMTPDGQRVKANELTQAQKQQYQLELLDAKSDAALKLADRNNAAAFQRVNAQQAGATTRQGMGDTAAMERAQLASDTKLKTSKYGMQPANIAYIQQQAQDSLSLIDNEILQAGGKPGEFRMRPAIAGAVGIKRALEPTRFIYGTQQRAGDATINRLKAKLIVDLIGEMKAQSKTGATGFGQLNIKELAVLENAASKLDPTLDQQTFLNELLRIREKLAKVLQPSDGLNPTTTNKEPVTADDYLKEQGLQ